MGRKRKHNDGLPPRVYRGKSAYEYRPPGGGCVRLCGLGMARAAIFDAYNKIVRESTPRGLVRKLVEAYLASAQYKKLAAETQRTYERQSTKLIAVFGRVSCDALKTQQIRRFMDEFGQISEKSANRHLALLSTICAWGRERGYLNENPCIGVRRFSERARERYVTDDELAAFLEGAPAPLRAAAEIAYLCAARLSDVLALTEFQLRDEGIFIRQGKTGKAQIKAWTPRLREATDLCRRSAPKGTTWVICNERGKGYSRDGFSTLWQRHRAAFDVDPETGKTRMDWTFHDLKAKGISDYEGDKKRFSGHATDRMVSVYDRKVQVVPTIGSDDSK